MDIWDRNLVDFDNGPVIIRNNKISITDPINWAVFGINLGGWWGQGVSNAVVEGNTITGWTATVVWSGPYGHHRRIINNDLSGAMAWQGAIDEAGRDGLIAGNTFGPTDIEFATNMFGAPWAANAITIIAQDPNQPLPVTGNVIMGNDFRLTGLSGWGYNAAGDLLTPGCVLLLSLVDMGWYAPWPGAEVTNNLVIEIGRFPRGTGGPKRQVLEFPVYAHDNRIVGHAGHGCDYSQLEAANPGIGRKIMEAGAKFMQLQQKKQAFVKQLMEEAKEH